MRVLVASGADGNADGLAPRVARQLAGAEGEVVFLGVSGPVPATRAPSSAEVASLRAALAAEVSAASAPDERRSSPVVGYVCAGVGLFGPRTGEVVVVLDHADLCWRSPLTGPNDDLVGPRFPRVDAVYEPNEVRSRVAVAPSVTISSAVVGGVHDEGHVSDWEVQTVTALGIDVVSSRLVPVAVVAAHMGVRLAAAVIV